MTIAHPSMLSFERKLETSDALMFSGSWDNNRVEQIKATKVNDDGKAYEVNVSAWRKVPITKRQNRSTQSAEGISDEKKKSPNPASSDSDDANLFDGNDTLKISFSIRVIGNLGLPFGCNSPEFEVAIKNKVDGFKRAGDISEVAYRYAYNIANGRFLWRNRVGAEEVMINVQIKDQESALEFNAYDFSLNNFNKNRDNSNLIKLAKVFERGLLGDEESFELIKVKAYSKLGNSQHVFPSQEMNMNEKGKTLFKLEGSAAMHNVKIGNAIRTIDTWYPRFETVKSPIAIEPYGSVTQKGDAYRMNDKEGNLYSLMVNWVNDKELSQEERQFVVANLIRGGVFSKSSTK